MSELWYGLVAFFGALDAQALFLIVVLLLGIRGFSRTVGGENPIEFWHFFSTKVREGDKWKDWGDPNKLGIMVGIFASTLIVGYAFWAAESYSWYIVVIFFIWLTFIAGVEYFSKLARSVAAKIAEKRLGIEGGKEAPKE